MSGDILDKIRVILVEPHNPLNVGAVIRAMKNMGMTRLRLVNPAPMDLEQTQVSAHRTTDVLEHLEIFSSLDEALSDVHVSYGFSARHRTRTWASLDMERAVEQGLGEIREGANIGFVFGREQSGLTNDELMRCHYRVHIETSSYSSLNLAQAVLLACYSAHRQVSASGEEVVVDNHAPKTRRATQNEQTRLLKCIHETLIEVGYYKAATKSTAMHRLQNIFQRASLHDDEIRLLMGMFGEVSNYVKLVDRGIRPEKIRPIDNYLDFDSNAIEKKEVTCNSLGEVSIRVSGEPNGTDGVQSGIEFEREV